ncbi:MAG: type VI secretion system ATPase TssH, partial [Calditrichia bacterium]|nr:type VI secretion system ATPase TssH [Calditrichia bacterium]
MNYDKMTIKTQEALSRSQQIAMDYSHQEIQPEHIFYSALEEDKGIIPSILKKLGISVLNFKSELEDSLKKYPKVQGAPGKIYLSPATNQIINESFKEAKKLKDEYISLEHLLLAAFNISGNLEQVLKKLQLKKEDILKALTGIRGQQRVTSQNPEATYQALEKFAR